MITVEELRACSTGRTGENPYRMLARAADALTAKDSELAEARARGDEYERLYRQAHLDYVTAEYKLTAAEEALERCQGALAMMIDPDQVKQTSVAHAFAAAVAAEARARTVLSREKEAGA